MKPSFSNTFSAKNVRVNRRDLLKASLWTLAGLSLSEKEVFARKETPQKTRPNILFIITDQQFSDAMSCSGNYELHTPAMDSLASNGVSFTKAYCSNPLCVPSRTSMFTGRMPHRTGVMMNMLTKKNSVTVPMLGKTMSGSGYDCGYFGKWHLAIPTEQVKLHGFPAPKHTVEGSPKRDPKTAEDCVKFVKKKREKPFFAVASFVNPHDICEWARGEVGPEGPIQETPPPARGSAA